MNKNTVAGSNLATSEVLEIGKIHFEGNVIPHLWYQNILKENGKADMNAINILAEIVYWYRPIIKKDERSGREIRYEKKFAADLLQKSKIDLADQFGISERQVQQALKRLEDLGLITRVLRNVQSSSGLLPNRQFIAINSGKIAKISHEKVGVCGKKMPDTKQKNATYVAKKCQRIHNTKITTQIPTENISPPESSQSSDATSSSLHASQEQQPPQEKVAKKHPCVPRPEAKIFTAELASKIKKMHKNSSVPTEGTPRYRKWECVIEDMLAIDNWKLADMNTLIDWIAKDWQIKGGKFHWGACIQSAAKFREKFGEAWASYEIAKSFKPKNDPNAGIPRSLNDDPEERMRRGGIPLSQRAYDIMVAKEMDMRGYFVRQEEVKK